MPRAIVFVQLLTLLFYPWVKAMVRYYLLVVVNIRFLLIGLRAIKTLSKAFVSPSKSYLVGCSSLQLPDVSKIESQETTGIQSSVILNSILTL